MCVRKSSCPAMHCLQMNAAARLRNIRVPSLMHTVGIYLVSDPFNTLSSSSKFVSEIRYSILFFSRRQYRNYPSTELINLSPGSNETLFTQVWTVRRFHRREYIQTSKSKVQTKLIPPVYTCTGIVNSCELLGQFGRVSKQQLFIHKIWPRYYIRDI